MLDCSFGGVPLPTGKEGAARGDACAAGVTPAPAGTHPRGQEVLVTHGPGVEGGTWGYLGGAGAAVCSFGLVTGSGKCAAVY